MPKWSSRYTRMNRSRRAGLLAFWILLAILMCVALVPDASFNRSPWQSPGAPHFTPYYSSVAPSVRHETLKTFSAASGGTTAAINVPAGDAIYVFITYQTTSRTVSSITDTATDTFVSNRNVISGTAAVEHLYVVNKSLGNAANTVTVSLSGSATGTITYIDIAGQNQTASWDVYGAGTTSAGNTTITDKLTGANVPHLTNELILIGGSVAVSSTFAAVGAFTKVDSASSTSNSGAVYGEPLASPAGVTCQITTTSGAWAGLCVAVRPAFLPSPPTSLHTTSIATGSISLAWTIPAGNSGLTLQYLYDGWHCGAASNRVTLSTSATTYNATPLNPGTTYCFWVTDSNASGESPASNYLVAQTKFNAPDLDVRVNVTNSQATGTGTYQQMVTVNSSRYAGYANANFSNVAWFYANGTQIYSWIESNNSNASAHTVVWLRLFNIAATTTVTIHMDVFAKAAYFRSEYGPSGIAPQLSATYGFSDDGATVFNFYDDFRGGALLPHWNGLTSCGATVSNGLRFAIGNSCAWESTIEWGPGTQVLLYRANLTTQGPGSNAGVGFIGTNNGSRTLGLACSGCGGGNYWGLYVTSGAYSQLTTSWGLADYTIEWNASGSAAYYQGQKKVGSDASGAPTMQFQGIGGYSASTVVAYSVNYTALYTSYPFGVMPTATFVTPSAPTGFSVTSTTSTTLSLGWTNPTFAANDTLYWGTSCSALVPYNVAPVSGGSLGLVTTFTATTATPSHTYCFALSASNVSGQGTWAFTNGTTLAAGGPATNLTASVMSQSRVLLIWTQGPGTVVNNTVYYGTVCSVWIAALSTGGAVTEFNVTGLPAGTSLCFSVTAWTTNQSAQSNLARAITLPNPGGVINNAPPPTRASGGTNQTGGQSLVPSVTAQQVVGIVLIGIGVLVAIGGERVWRILGVVIVVAGFVTLLTGGH